MSQTSRKYKGFGTLMGAKRLLWRLMNRAEEKAHDDGLPDDAQRGWANTGIQAILGYVKLVELHEMQKEMAHLEHLASHGNGHRP